MGRWGDGEMREAPRRGEGEIGRWGEAETRLRVSYPRVSPSPCPRVSQSPLSPRPRLSIPFLVLMQFQRDIVERQPSNQSNEIPKALATRSSSRSGNWRFHALRSEKGLFSSRSYSMMASG